MKISEFEKRRAANLIWNGARDYTIDTGFRVYDYDGHAQLYWNSLVGAIHFHYDWDKLMAFYHLFDATVYQTLYESLYWIALENCTFLREVRLRPAFAGLRRAYARQEIAHHALGVSDDNSAVVRSVSILLGHLHHILGEQDHIPDIVDAKLLAEIELGPGSDTDGVIASLTATLEKYTAWRDPKTHGGKNEILPRVKLFHFLPVRRKPDPEGRAPVRRLAFGYGEHVDEYKNETLDQSHHMVSFAKYTAQSDEGLKDYITDYFGTPLLSERETKAMEKAYCQGNHADVKLYFTRGDYTEEMLSHGYAGRQHKLAIAASRANEAAYRADPARHRLAVMQLTEKIRNSYLMRLADEEILSNAGQIAPARIWRATKLGEDHIFLKKLPGDSGSLTVDIVLDGSASQKDRTAAVSAQGYMIAEALTNVGIPVRVTSFCSMSGYMVVQVLRDYRETGRNKNIFRYFTAGANRDGLMIRVAAGMIEKNPADHHFLIMLSDCRPNDMIKMKTADGQYRDYAASDAVEDTAAEVHAARLAGIRVLCVFTGPDESLAAVRRIYGRDFARIRSLDMFADAVGRLLTQQIGLL